MCHHAVYVFIFMLYTNLSMFKPATHGLQ